MARTRHHFRLKAFNTGARSNHERAADHEETGSFMARSFTMNPEHRASARKPPSLRFFHSSSSALFSTTYHVVFSTKYRKPMLSADIRQDLHSLLEGMAKEQPGGIKLIATGIEIDHVHLVLSVPPSVAVASPVQKIKGRTSHDLRAKFPALAEAAGALWQRGYFCRGLGDVSMPQVVAYMAKQAKEGSYLSEAG